MYIYAYAYTCVCMCIYIYIEREIHTPISLSLCIYIYIYIHVLVVERLLVDEVVAILVDRLELLLRVGGPDMFIDLYIAICKYLFMYTSMYIYTLLDR